LFVKTSLAAYLYYRLTQSGGRWPAWKRERPTNFRHSRPRVQSLVALIPRTSRRLPRHLRRPGRRGLPRQMLLSAGNVLLVRGRARGPGASTVLSAKSRAGPHFNRCLIARAALCLPRFAASSVGGRRRIDGCTGQTLRRAASGSPPHVLTPHARATKRAPAPPWRCLLLRKHPGDFVVLSGSSWGRQRAFSRARGRGGCAFAARLSRSRFSTTSTCAFDLHPPLWTARNSLSRLEEARKTGNADAIVATPTGRFPQLRPPLLAADPVLACIRSLMPNRPPEACRPAWSQGDGRAALLSSR